jgi:hypothetical protein
MVYLNSETFRPVEELEREGGMTWNSSNLEFELKISRFIFLTFSAFRYQKNFAAKKKYKKKFVQRSRNCRVSFSSFLRFPSSFLRMNGSGG